MKATAERLERDKAVRRKALRQRRKGQLARARKGLFVGFFMALGLFILGVIPFLFFAGEQYPDSAIPEVVFFGLLATAALFGFLDEWKK